MWEAALAVLRSRGGSCKLLHLVPLLDAGHVKTIRDGKGAKSFFARKSCAHLFEVLLPPGDGPGNELVLDRHLKPRPLSLVPLSLPASQAGVPSRARHGRPHAGRAARGTRGALHRAAHFQDPRDTLDLGELSVHRTVPAPCHT